MLVKSKYYDIMQVFLVTGGRRSRRRSLSSTEIFVGSVWSYAASLPSKISDMPALTLDNSVFVFGERLRYVQPPTKCLTLYTGGKQPGRKNISKSILRYNGTSNKWSHAGNMTRPRLYHTVGPHDPGVRFIEK